MGINSNSLKYIVTHGGSAHKDDFMACAIAMAQQNSILPVERRDPTPGELEDPQVLVLDVGMRHEPHKGNYDHHQLPRGTEECALSLMLQDMGMHQLFLKLYGWYQPLVWLDTLGPVATAKKLGMTKEAFLQTLDPVGWGIQQLWETAPGMYANLLLKLGTQLLDFARKVQDELAAIPFHTSVGNSDGVRIITVGQKFEEKTMDLHRKSEAVAGGPIGISICPDERGPGWTLYRIDDHPQVDFSKLEHEQGIVFAHKGGFIAKTVAMPSSDAVILACKAIF